MTRTNKRKPLIPPMKMIEDIMPKPKRKPKDPLAGLKKTFSLRKSKQYPDLIELVLKGDFHVCYVRSDILGWSLARAIAKLGGEK